jgi:predicted restriction endonuclease
MSIPEYKICPKCQENKHLSEYHLRKDKGYIYLKSYCKKCSNKLTTNGQYNQCSCGKRKTKKSNRCQSCSNANQQKYETLEDILHYRSRYGQSAAFNIVRGRARSLLTHSKCQKCGYDKHVEACHIKPISSFPNNTLIDTINAPDNLLALCPNCHWEFDHNQQS